LKGVAFFDAGNAWDRFGDFRSYPSLNKGVGLGIRLTIPGTVILIRFDFGYPLDPQPGTAQTMNYHFNIGNIF
jgi:outer membrane translocation and assembly module TamA